MVHCTRNQIFVSAHVIFNQSTFKQMVRVRSLQKGRSSAASTASKHVQQHDMLANTEDESQTQDHMNVDETNGARRKISQEAPEETGKKPQDRVWHWIRRTARGARDGSPSTAARCGDAKLALAFRSGTISGSGRPIDNFD